MNSLLLWIGGLLCAVLGLLFAAPYVIDWNAYRGVFEEEASRILGRDVRVGGQVNLRLLPSPYVRFEKVRISDAGAALGEPFFRAEAFTLWLSPTPLLKGAIEASEVELDRPVLRLAVDNEGRGNWQALKLAPGALPFVPSDVVLQQVRIRQGIVSLRTPGAVEPLTLSGVDGEVAAASLDGPYRFRGMIDWYGSRRELRVGTAQREADGKLRYKASVRSADTGNLYTLDGVLSEVSARARHTGILTARLPLASVFGGLIAAEGRTLATRSAATDAIDLKANIEGDLDGAKLSDLAFAFEQNGKPQLMNGEMVASWRNGLRIETRLASRWLDLDQIVGLDGRKVSPIDTFRRLIGQLNAMLAKDGTSLLTIDVDQVTLGSDALSGVRLALARAGGLTSIGELKAALPGNARGELRGTIGAPPAQKEGVAPTAASAANDSVGAFEGEIVLRGSSYQRFAAWAGATAILAPAAAGEGGATGDAPFSIATGLRLEPDGVVLSNAQIEVGSRQIKADADWRWGGTPSLQVSAEGRSIDIGIFAPGALDLVSASRSKPDSAAAGQHAPDGGSTVLTRLGEHIAAVERAAGSLRLKLKSGELTDGTTVLKDVDADLAIKDGGLTLTGMRFAAINGARLELAGALQGLRGKPAGQLRGWVSAPGPAAVVATLDALPGGARGMAGRWLGQSGNVDAGFSLTFGGSAADNVTVSANGVVDNARVVLDLKLEGGLAQWREGPFSLALDAEESRGVAVIRRLAGRAVGRTGPAAPIDAASLNLRAAGANVRSIVTTAMLDTRSSAGPSNATFTGNSAIRPDNSVELAGEVALNAASAADLLVMAGASRRSLLPGAPVRGTFAWQQKDGATTLSASALDIGASRVGGRVTMAAKGDRTRIEGQISANRIGLAGMLGVVLDGNAAPSRDTDAAQDGSPWPDAPFALAEVDGIEGQLVVTSGELELFPGLGLSSAEARLAFSPGRIEIQSIAGATLGGRFTARGSIAAAAAGADVSLEARLTGAQLAQLTPAGTGPNSASGEANATLSLSGRALSPRGVMAAANGRGEIEIRNGRVRGIAATLVEKAAQAAVEGSEGLDRAALERLFATERDRTSTVIGNRKLPIDLTAGAARIGALEIAVPESVLRNTTTLDLVQLKVDSEWQITSRRALPGAERASGQKRDALPPVSLIWTSPLAALPRAEPRLSIDQFEREITIRRMEREADRLEQMRRQDDERIRELERQRQPEAPDRRSDPVAPPSQAPVTSAPQVVPAEAPPPPPRLVRPPAPQRKSDAKSLQELLMGQQ